MGGGGGDPYHGGGGGGGVATRDTEPYIYLIDIDSMEPTRREIARFFFQSVVSLILLSNVDRS